MKFENPAPISRSELERALLSSEPNTVAEAIIRMALWESDFRWAEQKTLQALNDDRDEVRRAALLAIGHLGRIHQSLDLRTVIPAVKRMLHDPKCRGTAEDTLQDISIYMAGGTLESEPPKKTK